MMRLGLFCMAASFFPLYLKYRVVLTGERCKGKITGIVEQKCGYTVGGVAVKKHAYQIKIGQKQYYTAHGGDSMTFYVPHNKKSLWIRHPGRKSDHIFGKNENLHIDRGGFQISVLL